MRSGDAGSRLRIVVFGYVVRGPLAGFAWHHLQYVSGLVRLGHDAIFVEDSGDFPGCYDPTTGDVAADPGYGLRFLGDAAAACGIGARWAYFDAHKGEWHGPRGGEAVRFCAEADLLINLNDATPLRDWLARIPVRALIDTDPVFTQVAHLQDVGRRQAAAQHTVFFTFGENLGTEHSTAPDDGFPWQPTRQPIDLSLWVPGPPSPTGRWTTIMQWDSYPALVHAGVDYGMKSASFAAYRDLPQRVSEPLEMALGSPSAPREELQRAGWHLRNPLSVSGSLAVYRGYIAGSKGEFSVAKHGYVVPRSGWFSERTACYLASGRPAVVQDTGFSRLLPCGDGLLAFASPDEAAACLADASRRYPQHCVAARAIACEHFGSDRVLASLVERAMNVSTAVPA
jgi:hypothetical protein